MAALVSCAYADEEALCVKQKHAYARLALPFDKMQKRLGSGDKYEQMLLCCSDHAIGSLKLSSCQLDFLASSYTCGVLIVDMGYLMQKSFPAFFGISPKDVPAERLALYGHQARQRPVCMRVPPVTQACCQHAWHSRVKHLALHTALSNGSVHLFQVKPHLYEQHVCMRVPPVTQDCCQHAWHSRVKHLALHSALSNGSVHLFQVKQHLYEQHVCMRVPPVTQACCQHAWHSRVKHLALHSALSNGSVHLFRSSNTSMNSTSA